MADDDASQPVPTPSELAQPVSESAPAPTTQADPVEQTAQVPVNEPLSPEHEPITPAPASAPQAHPARDLLVKARATIQDRKHKKLEKILEFLNMKGKITNDEVEKLLHVSDATATRYLSTLEKDGKIKQVGKTGTGVAYTKV